jgi:hypothetical protein
MKKVIRLTESQLIGLIKKIIKEEKYSEQDLTYFNPEIGKECKIKIARNKNKMGKTEEYKPVLVCDMYDTGNEIVVAEVSFSAPTIDEVKDFICDNYEMVIADLDSMFDEEEENIMEAVDSRRWDIIDEPIFCGSDEFENLI